MMADDELPFSLLPPVSGCLLSLSSVYCLLRHLLSPVYSPRAAAALITPVNALADIWPDLIEMHHVAFTMSHVGHATAAINENPQARTVTLGRLEAKLVKHWRTIRAPLEQVTAGPGSAMTLAAAIGADTDGCADPARAGAVFSRAAALRWEMIARLAAIAMQAEEMVNETKA